MVDAGKDDWLSARPWGYINQHGALLTRIDDISGEQGRDIGHATHDVGTDIDLYHVYRFAGATSGTDDYNRLRNTLIRVLSLPDGQTEADRAALTSWVTRRDRVSPPSCRTRMRKRCITRLAVRTRHRASL